MKIIFLLDQLHHGGIATSYLRWAEQLLAHGYPVAIFCQKHGGNYASQVPSGTELHINNSRRAILASWGLYRYLRRQPRGSVVVAGGFTLPFAQALRPRGIQLWAHMPSSPGLGSKLETHQSRLAENLRYGLMKWATRRANLVSAVSRGTAGDVETWANLPAGSVATLYNPACTEVFLNAPSLPAPHLWLSDANLQTFCSFGRLEATKNYTHLLQAFSRVHQAHPSARLLIGGNGRLKASLEHTIQSLFQKPYPVQLLGNVANPEAYMAHATAYVSSSQLEAFGNVLVEALATGTRVIATDAPYGPSEILTTPEVGTLVPLHDVEALATAMQNVMAVPPAQGRQLRINHARGFTATALWPMMSSILNTLNAKVSL